MELQMDQSTNLFKINPRVFAAGNEEFLIYSPVNCSYVFMSKDLSLTGKLHSKLELHENRHSARNLFKLCHVDGKDVFHIFNIETEKYIYISGHHVLGIGGSPSYHKNGSKFEFSFKEERDTGCYYITQGNMCLDISKNNVGIPPCKCIEAVDESVCKGENIFQFVLEKDVRSATIEYDMEKNRDVITDLSDDSKVIHENSSSTDYKAESTVDTSYPKNDEFIFENGFEYIGRFIGGIPHRTIENGIKRVVVFGHNTENSTEPIYDTLKLNQTTEITIPPNRKVILTRKVEKIALSVPFTIQVATANKKILKGNGTWIGGSYLNTATHQDFEILDDEKECE